MYKIKCPTCGSEYEQQINYIEKVLIPTNKITIHRVLDDKSQYFENRLFIANDEITKMKEENEKLKKSREVLRSAFEVIARGESQFDNVDHMYTAREALKADSEIMEGK